MNSMSRTDRWKQFLIIFVLIITLYNIAPTIIYYAKPIDKNIQEAQADEIIDAFSKRAVDRVEKSEQWICSFLQGLNISPTTIQKDPIDQTLFHIRFQKEEEADLVSRWIEYAAFQSISEEARRPVVMKAEGISLDIALAAPVIPSQRDAKKLYTYFQKKSSPSSITNEDDKFLSYIQKRYKNIIRYIHKGLFLSDESILIAKYFASQAAQTKENRKKYFDPFVLRIAPYIAELHVNTNSSILQRVLLSSLYSIGEKSRLESIEITKEKQSLLPLYRDLMNLFQERIQDLNTGLKNEKEIRFQEKLEEIYKAYRAIPITQIEKEAFQEEIAQREGPSLSSPVHFSIENPLFQTLALDLERNHIELHAHSDIQEMINASESDSHLRQFLRGELLQQAATIARGCGEEAQAFSETVYTIPLTTLPGATSFVQFSVTDFAQKSASSLLYQIGKFWKPCSVNLQKNEYPHFNRDQFEEILEGSEDQKMCLLAFSPSQLSSSQTLSRIASLLKPTSFYIIARGAQKIIDSTMTEEEKSQVVQEIRDLHYILQKHGFISYSGKELGQNFGGQEEGNKECASDLIFELEQFYMPYLSLTQEAFTTSGYLPVLEFSTLEQRLKTENRIDDVDQERLVRWKEMWQSAQVSVNPHEKLLVPKPTQNVLIANITKNIRKYIRGDYSRVLHWGLDLSGGKSIKVGLYDNAMRPITTQKELQRASSELYERLNGMGVSERVIRVENETISIDFPGSQDVSSQDLIQASALSFHIVHEKFSDRNKKLSSHVNAFLQEVWNEACLTNRKNLDEINAIASRRIQEVRDGREGVSEHLISLVDEGLDIRALQDPEVQAASSSFDDTFSMIVLQKTGRDLDSRHPLLIVFRNFALQGANLTNVHPSYDPIRGNILSFQVRSKDAQDPSRINPQDALYAWTSRFCPESIQGTNLQEYTQGRGWHMAVVLNGLVISAPDLSVAISDSACISGQFSQREVQNLARDIQAGALSYIPKVLSEYNVSPELGKIEWQKGIVGSSLAVLSVIGVMIAYYRFPGVVACIAVMINILIIWAIMQNIDAAMTLPGLAGIVLTVGMAVDANVLVFERVREELQQGSKLIFAIKNGYQRAFSAIVDSNLTTLIAAFILTQFDSGPVRGFAVTLIIGIISSMFTSLFMTKAYFSSWVKKHPEKTSWSMASWFPQSPNYAFSRYTKPIFFISALILGIGACSIVAQYRTLLGMDFTGGYALVVEVDEKYEHTPKEKVSDALQKAGLQIGEYHIRELGTPQLLRIQLSSSLDEPSKPFYQYNMKHGASTNSSGNPRITWIVEKLQEGGIVLSQSQIEKLPTQWSVISGQFSATMRNNALYALSLSLFAILIYIAVRFEWKYAISSVLALLHDLCMTIASIGILSWFGLNIQLNLEVIGALMTIIGYSLNDTIIVFDRVREESLIHKKMSFQDRVDLSLNSTLSRTIMTSSTTLSVLLMLVLFGGHALFTFSLIMFIGILLGTISSLFVAAPLLVYFDKEE